MSMIFWDTVRGHQLADTLIRTLPNLAEEKKQYLIELDDDGDYPDVIRNEIEKGRRFEQMLAHGGRLVLIFSK